jgi:membrane protein implicated in regulation of membrane protease activity
MVIVSPETVVVACALDPVCVPLDDGLLLGAVDAPGPLGLVLVHPLMAIATSTMAVMPITKIVLLAIEFLLMQLLAAIPTKRYRLAQKRSNI